MDTNRKVVAYCRIAETPIEQKIWLYASSGSLKQTEMMKAHIEMMKHQAEEKGFTVVGISTDTSRQTPLTARPGLQKMLAAVREGKVGAVMIPSLVHFSRELEESIPLIAELHKRKVGFYAKDASFPLPSYQIRNSPGKGGEER
jgi:hypothetical protein